MARWIWILVLLGACRRLPDTEAHLLRLRIETLRDDVERELGARLGPVVVAVRTPREMGELLERERIRIGDEPESPIFERGARVTSVLGYVDRRGRISICPEAFRITGKWIELDLSGSGFLDLVLAHELAHVYQRRRLGKSCKHYDNRDHADAVSATWEGHAEYIMARVAKRRGLHEALRLTRAFHRKLPPKLTNADTRLDLQLHFAHYSDGERFFTTVAERLGYRNAVRHIAQFPPRTRREILRPDDYLACARTRASAILRRLEKRKGVYSASFFSLSQPQKALRILGLRATADKIRDAGKVWNPLEYTIVLLEAESPADGVEVQRAWQEWLRHYSSVERDWVDVRVVGGQWQRINLGVAHEPVDAEYQHVFRHGPFVLDVTIHDAPGGPAHADRLAKFARAEVFPAWDERLHKVRRLDDLAEIEAAARDRDPDVRIAAYEALADHNRLTSDTDRDWLARWTLQRLKGNQRAALTDADPRVRAIACAHLGLHIPRERFRSLACDHSVLVRRAFWRAQDEGVRLRGDKAQALELLDRGLRDPDAVVRFHVASSMEAFVLDTEIASLWIKVLGEPVVRLKRHALDVLTETLPGGPPPELVEAIAGLLSDGEFTEEAAQALAACGESARPALDRVRPLLESADFDTRFHATRILFNTTQEAAAFLVMAREALSRSWLRNEALATLKKLGRRAEPFVPDLIRLLASRWAHEDAAEVLGLIGPPAAPALPKLRTLDSEQAKRAIQQIEAR